MTDKTQNTLTTVTKLISIIVVCVGLITYLYGVGQMAEDNKIAIEKNTAAIQKAQDIDSKIQLQLKEIETHLIYIRRALDE